ncbi:MAG: tetratricopeptide repeat protein, partial [Candidatus Krumholzibacteriia bacterium]
MSKLSTHHRRARDFIQREDWDNALSELQRVLGADGNNPTLHNQVGDVYLRKDDVVQACEHFEKSIELYATLGLHNNAVALCRKVIRLCPSRLEVRYRLARMRFEQSLRADAAISFGDYLDHVHPDSEHAGEVLEERCREITEGFPDDAPVGKILEKLEGQRSFACAFELVQRLAQRAADSGNDAAARRFTEKMRSLRVLVERSGGGDILSADPVPPPIETGDAPAEPGAAAAPQIVEPEPEMAARLESDRAPAGAPADSPPEVETVSGGVEWQPPRLV